MWLSVTFGQLIPLSSLPTFHSIFPHPPLSLSLIPLQNSPMPGPACTGGSDQPSHNNGQLLYLKKISWVNEVAWKRRKTIRKKPNQKRGGELCLIPNKKASTIAEKHAYSGPALGQKGRNVRWPLRALIINHSRITVKKKDWTRPSLYPYQVTTMNDASVIRALRLTQLLDVTRFPRVESVNYNKQTSVVYNLNVWCIRLHRYRAEMQRHNMWQTQEQCTERRSVVNGHEITAV